MRPFILHARETITGRTSVGKPGQGRTASFGSPGAADGSSSAFRNNSSLPSAIRSAPSRVMASPKRSNQSMSPVMMSGQVGAADADPAAGHAGRDDEAGNVHVVRGRPEVDGLRAAVDAAGHGHPVGVDAIDPRPKVAQQVEQIAHVRLTGGVDDLHRRAGGRRRTWRRSRSR